MERWELLFGDKYCRVVMGVGKQLRKLLLDSGATEEEKGGEDKNQSKSLKLEA